MLTFIIIQKAVKIHAAYSEGRVVEVGQNFTLLNDLWIVRGERSSF